jgi:hypothetical protein
VPGLRYAPASFVKRYSVQTVMMVSPCSEGASSANSARTSISSCIRSTRWKLADRIYPGQKCLSKYPLDSACTPTYTFKLISTIANMLKGTILLASITMVAMADFDIFTPTNPTSMPVSEVRIPSSRINMWSYYQALV